jgi:hypothetical protein
MRTSPNGAVIMSGVGVAAVRKKLEEEFQKARDLVVSSETAPLPPEPRATIYTEQNKTRFHERAKRLSLAALSSSHISTKARRDVVCWEVEIPTQTAEELYKATSGRDE